MHDTLKQKNNNTNKIMSNKLPQYIIFVVQCHVLNISSLHYVVKFQVSCHVFYILVIKKYFLEIKSDGVADWLFC